MILGVLIVPKTPEVLAAASNRKYSATTSPTVVDINDTGTPVATDFFTTVKNESGTGNVRYISVRITVPGQFTVGTVSDIPIDDKTSWKASVSGNVVTFTIQGKGSVVQGGIGPGEEKTFPIPATTNVTGSICGTGEWTTMVHDNGEAVGDPYVDVGLQGPQPTVKLNCAPVAVNDGPYSVFEGNSLTNAPSVLSNDSDPNSDPLTAVLVSQPAHGSAVLQSDGTFTYTPAAGWVGPDSFTYKATDGRLESNVATVSINVAEIDDPPTATNDTYETDEDVTLNVPAPGVLTNDSDPENRALTAGVVTQPGHGSVTLNSDGSFAYTPEANFSGTDTFTYKANDGAQDSNTATVTITVNADNDAPVAVNDTYAATEDTTLNVPAATGVLANDTDVDGPGKSAILVAGPSNGSLTFNSDGSFTYTPAGDFTGTDTFTYKASDGTAESNIATVTIEVAPVNDGPVAMPDAYTLAEDEVFTAPAPGVLANDTDIDGLPLTAEVVSQPAHGTVTLNSDGSFTYTPQANYSGSDSFTYKAFDGTVYSAVTTVSLTITVVDDPPTAVDDALVTDEEVPVSFTEATLLGNDSDPEGEAMTVSIITQPSNGTLTMDSAGYIYTPNENFSGTDSFTYKAMVGAAGSNTATVTITVRPVNDQPVAQDDTYSTNEDTPLVVITSNSILNNDSDPDPGDTLTPLKVGGPSYGTLTLNVDGTFTYTPNAGWSGTDWFTYQASDGHGGLSGEATVTITVLSVPDRPVALPDAHTVDEDTLLTVPAPGILSNDTDGDGDSLSAVLVTDVAHGTLTLSTDGSFTYQPAANFSGTDSFTYKASDGSLQSDVSTVTITVTAVPDPVMATDDEYSTDEDSVLEIPGPGVLTNDSDGDGDTLSAVINEQPEFGTVVLNADGSFVYTPSANYHGVVSFSYRATDGVSVDMAVVTITVNPVNDAPEAVDDEYTVNEDAILDLVPLEKHVLDNDTDADEETTLTATVLTNPTNGTLSFNGGAFTYTPNPDFFGTDTFTYQVSDGTATDSATVTITVTSVNDAPVAVNDSYTIGRNGTLTVPESTGVLANDTDTEDDSLTASIVNQPAHGTVTLNANGSFVYQPGSDYAGADSFTYKTFDGQAYSAEATVSITITADNRQPVATGDSASVAVGKTLTVAAPGLLANDSDPDGHTITVKDYTDPTFGTLTVAADGSFTYTHTGDAVGSDSFTYRITDSLLDSEYVTVSITITNQAPDAVNDTVNALVDTNPTGNVLSNDTDADGHALTASVVTSPGHGTLELSSNGAFTYTPTAGYIGEDSFTYSATDGIASDTATVTITISNTAPAATGDSYSTAYETVLTEATPGVLANDTDGDGHALTASVVTAPASGTLVLNANGSFSYTPNAGFSGADTFTYRVHDGYTYSTAATVTITVGAPERVPPVAVDDTASTQVNTPVLINAKGNDIDPMGYGLSISNYTQPAHGQVELADADNEPFIYTPNAGYVGSDSFQYWINGSGYEGVGPATVTITVNSAPNQAPVAVSDSYSATAGVTLTISAPGVLSNDSDPENQTLSAMLVTGPTGATLTLNSNGSFSFRADNTGTYTFSYMASDGSMYSSPTTVTITVTRQSNPDVTNFQVERLVSTTNNISTAAGSLTVESGTPVFYFLRLVNTGDTAITVSQATDTVLGPVSFPATTILPFRDPVVTVVERAAGAAGTTETGTLTVVASGLTRTASSTVKVSDAKPTGSITVIVATPAGAPIPGADVTLNGQTRTAGADGTVTFENLPLGQYGVSVTAKNPANPNDASQSGTQTATLSTAQPDQTVVFQFAWEALNLALTINVVDATNPAVELPIQGALVTFNGNKAYTNVDGQVFFDNLEAGQYQVEAMAHNPRLAIPAQPKTAKAPVTISDALAGQTITLRLSWQPEPLNIGSLTIEVVDKATGKHVPGAKISLTNGKTTESVTSDKDGFYSFGQIDAGSYIITAQSPDAVKSGSKEALVIAEASNRVVVEISGQTIMAATGDISGRICRPREPGVTLIARGPNGEEKSATIPSTGILGQWEPYAFKNLTSGVWKLLFTVGGEVKAEQSITVAAGGITSAADFELACTGGSGPAPSPFAWILYLAGGALLLSGLVLRSRKQQA